MEKIKVICIVFLLSISCSCEKSSDAATAAASNTGKAGSLSKFTIIGNYIYAVSSHFLYTIDISDPSKPTKVNESPLNYDMETIYPYKNTLFIGSKTGLYVYSLENAAEPKLIGEAKHGRSCDPVIANDSASYSTLKGNSACGPATSGLYVYDIRNLDRPELKKTIPIDEPIGLGMEDSVLYVCCANEGMKVFSIKNAYDPVEITKIPDAGFIDVIPYNDILICWVNDGISLYDISKRFQPAFIKKISN